MLATGCWPLNVASTPPKRKRAPSATGVALFGCRRVVLTNGPRCEARREPAPPPGRTPNTPRCQSLRWLRRGHVADRSRARSAARDRRRIAVAEQVGADSTCCLTHRAQPLLHGKAREVGDARPEVDHQPRFATWAAAGGRGCGGAHRAVRLRAASRRSPRQRAARRPAKPCRVTHPGDPRACDSREAHHPRGGDRHASRRGGGSRSVRRRPSPA